MSQRASSSSAVSVREEWSNVHWARTVRASDAEVNRDLPRLVDLAPGVPDDLFWVHAAGRETVNDELAKHGRARVAADARGARKFGDVGALGDDRRLELLERLNGARR